MELLSLSLFRRFANSEKGRFLCCHRNEHSTALIYFCCRQRKKNQHARQQHHISQLIIFIDNFLPLGVE
jgi:hypothetical protein